MKSDPIRRTRNHSLTAAALLIMGQLLSCAFLPSAAFAADEAHLSETISFETEAEPAQQDPAVLEETGWDYAALDEVIADEPETEEFCADELCTDGLSADELTLESELDQSLEDLIEEITEAQPPESSDGEVCELEEFAQIDDPVVAKINDDRDPAEKSASGRIFTKRMLAAAEDPSEDPFTGSYYDQLSSTAKTFYLYRYEQFAAADSTDSVQQTYTKATQVYKFPVDSSYFSVNENGKITITDANALKLTDEYRTGHETLLYELRASFDALCYDHPEIFWTRKTNINIGYGAMLLEDGYYLYLSKLVITPVEVFAGAAGLAGQFREAVTAAAQQIASSCDYDEDGSNSQIELLQAIHDYICARCDYDYDGLAEYQADPEHCTDYRIFTPCGAFLDNIETDLVCEGFSKAFKILCDRFDIPCILMLGKQNASSSLAHQWNAVQLDGKWFLVDLTNDDSRASFKDYRKYAYFMCPEIRGRVYTYELGGSVNTDSSAYGWVSRPMTFAYPAIASGTHTFQAPGEADTPCEHYVQYICSEDPQVCFYLYKEHLFEFASAEMPPACTQDGKRESYLCAHCGSIRGGEPIPATGHSFTNGICEICGAVDLSKAVIDHIPKQSFYGKAVTPSLTVRLGERILKEGTDYRAVYASNQKIGDAQAQITPLGDNVGSGSISFRIVPKPVKLKSVKNLGRGKLKVVWKKISGITNYQVELSQDPSFHKFKKYSAKKTLKTRTISKLKIGRTYYVRIRAYRVVKGVRFHGYWSDYMKIKM